MLLFQVIDLSLEKVQPFIMAPFIILMNLTHGFIKVTDKVLITEPCRYHCDLYHESVMIYSYVTGEFIEEVVAPDSQYYDKFGSCLSASGSYFVVGAMGDDDYTGSAYLLQLSDPDE